MVPTSMLEHEGLTSTDRSVFMALCSYAKWDESVTRGECFPGLQKLQQRSGCCRNTLLRSIARLERLNLVKKTTGDASKSNRYVLTVSELPVHQVNKFTECTGSSGDIR